MNKECDSHSLSNVNVKYNHAATAESLAFQSAALFHLTCDLSQWNSIYSTQPCLATRSFGCDSLIFVLYAELYLKNIK